MKYGIYAIFDVAAGVFTAPTIDISDASAVRNFQMALENSGSVMNFKPDDFSLYQLGTFDVETGKIDAWPVPSRLIVGSDGDYRKEIADKNV